MTTMPESFFGWVTFLLHQYGDVLLKGACCRYYPDYSRGSKGKCCQKGSCKSDSIGLECLCRTFPRYADDRTGYGSILWCYEYV